MSSVNLESVVVAPRFKSEDEIFKYSKVFCTFSLQPNLKISKNDFSALWLRVTHTQNKLTGK